MTRMQSVAAVVRAALTLLLVLSGAATASAQTSLIYGLSPSRGGSGGGTTVEVIGNGWFTPGVTTVTMTGGAAQPTSVTVHDSRRLTFVTPPRAASPTP